MAAEQLDLQPGDLVDFWRKPATKDESGWRGPATVVAPRTPGSSPQGVATSVRWQGRTLSVRTQDLRRALVYLAMLMLPAWGEKTPSKEDLLSLIIAFADGLVHCLLVRLEWLRFDVNPDDRGSHGSVGVWRPAIASQLEATGADLPRVSSSSSKQQPAINISRSS